MAWEFAKQRVHELIHASPYEWPALRKGYPLPKVFEQFVPEVGNAGELPAPVLAVQVTRPAASDGGDALAVGVSLHHTASNGRSVWQFIRAWAAAALEGSPVAPGLLPPPVFDRDAIRDPAVRDLTPKSMKTLATTGAAHVDAFPFLVPGMAQQRRRTFWLRADEIQSLKAAHMATRRSRRRRAVVRLRRGVVPSVGRASIVRAKAMAHAGDDDVYFLLSADCRRRLRPPVEEGYFGNCVMGCCARATVAELSRGGGDGDGLVRAAAAIQRAIGEGLKDPMADVEDLNSCEECLWQGRQRSRQTRR
ncbi:hypothetical protein ACP70R_018362 [Stipagrostis hirtigluma subsp. patula]